MHNTPQQPDHSDVTRLIALAVRGDRVAEGELLDTIYAELHAIASRAMSGERSDLTIGATAVVNEAYLRLFRPGGTTGSESWSSRRAFYSVAAQAMRRVLIDHARKRSAAIRGGESKRIPLSLDILSAARQGDPAEIMALTDAIVRLESVDQRAAEIVRLRFFTGLTIEQTAEVMNLAPRTVKRDWEFARAWLESALFSSE